VAVDLPTGEIAKRRSPAQKAGERRRLLHHCEDRDDERDDENQPEEAVDRHAAKNREDHQQDNQ
jgi:hypothetical protein